MSPAGSSRLSLRERRGTSPRPGFADADVEGFCRFVGANKSRDLMIVHHLLMLGLNRVAPARPDFVIEYLLEDPRHFAVGDAYDIHRGSRALIAAVVPALASVAAVCLERAVMTWQLYRETPTVEDAPTRFVRLRWARESRLRLLRSSPRECLSLETRRYLEGEERALPDTRDYDHERLSLVPTTRSRMSAAQMARAGDDDIVRLFEELVDDARWSSELASREFAEFAKGDPQRALRICERFEPGRQERPAGQALAALGGSSVPPSMLVARSHELAERGFGLWRPRKPRQPGPATVSIGRSPILEPRASDLIAQALPPAGRAVYSTARVCVLPARRVLG